MRTCTQALIAGSSCVELDVRAAARRITLGKARQRWCTVGHGPLAQEEILNAHEHLFQRVVQTRVHRITACESLNETRVDMILQILTDARQFSMHCNAMLT